MDHQEYRALDGVSLSLQPGMVLGLVGRNGAGKSTLIECLLGLRIPDQGQAMLFGKPATQLDDSDKAALGYVPQNPESLAWMKLGSMLGLMAELYPSWDAALVERLLQRWELNPKLDLLKLSPGQRQQVAIIRALAPRPRLLVLDEPAAALDPLARRELMREIVELAGEYGTTVLFSTHIMSDLERVASHIALLHQGRIQLLANLDELKDDLRRVVWPQQVALPTEPLPGELARKQLADGSWNLVLRHDAASSAFRLPEQARVHSLGLEDLFVELTA